MDVAEPATSAEWIARLVPADAHAHTRRLADYWLSIHPGPDTLPGRRHFDPLDLPGEIWPHLGLTEPLGEPFDLRYRLVGTALVDYMGGDYTGATLRTRSLAFANRTVDEMLAPYRIVCAARRPVYDVFPLLERNRGYAITLERLHLPLATNGRDVDMVVSSVVSRGEAEARRR